MEISLAHFSTELASLVERTAASVVTVHARPRITSSGVLWAPGVVVTADHTVTRDDQIHLTLPSGERVAAQLRGRDGSTDLAVLTFEGDGGAPLGRASKAAQAGHLLLVVGRNADTGPTAALGILSAAGGEWKTWRGGKLDQFLRLDVSLFPGSVGGAVVNIEGDLVGVASDGLSRLSPLAIPVATVDRVVAELLAKGRIARPYLGVGLQPVQLPSGPGLILLSVEAGSAADKAGLLVGDVLLGLGGSATEDPGDVQTILHQHQPGHKLSARIVRGGEHIEVEVEIGEKEA
ncbi:MAG: S1C family serine protease [Acidobacteria bacterium]|nr:S1C family serine protease [Acidobacteriota bacterium]